MIGNQEKTQIMHEKQNFVTVWIQGNIKEWKQWEERIVGYDCAALIMQTLGEDTTGERK